MNLGVLAGRLAFLSYNLSSYQIDQLLIIGLFPLRRQTHRKGILKVWVGEQDVVDVLVELGEKRVEGEDVELSHDEVQFGTFN